MRRACAQRWTLRFQACVLLSPPTRWFCAPREPTTTSEKAVLSRLRMAAAQGNAQAQFDLGKRYLDGGMEPEAVRLFRLAAAQGHAGANFELGALPEDIREVVRLFRLAADQGHAEAQYDLGNIYFHGEGVEQDFQEAARLFRLAADQGHEWGQLNLANCYVLEQGNVEATRIFRLLAEKGNATAQYNLGLMYLQSDRKEAAKWVNRAAEQGYPQARLLAAAIREEAK